MPDPQLPLQQPPHQNRQLFSDHYLNEILSAHPGWQALAPRAQALLAELTDLFDRYTPSQNERQTEKDLVCPVLDLLGHTYEVQAPLKTPDVRRRPTTSSTRTTTRWSPMRTRSSRRARHRPFERVQALGAVEAGEGAQADGYL